MKSFSSETYDLALQLNDKISAQQIGLIVFLFKEKGFEILDLKNQNSHTIFIKFDKILPILKEAEILRIQKPILQNINSNSTHSKNTMRNILARNITRSLDAISPNIRKYENYETITPNLIHKYVSKCPDYIEDFENITMELKKNILSIFNSSELIRIKYSIIKKLKLMDLNIIEFLKNQKLLIGLFVLYENDKLLINLKSFEHVFGEKVSLYFKFMKNYIYWLIFPAFLGLSNKYFNYIFTESFDFLLINCLYSFLITVWFTFFLVFWQRKQNEINIEFGSYGKIFLVADKNPDFQAPEQIDLVTGLVKASYSKRRRLFLYFISILEAIPFLLLGFVIKVFFLNIKGLFAPGEILYFDMLGDLVKEGSFLHGIVHYRLILDFLQIEATSITNTLYKRVCKISTQRENHRTNQSFENSYALKRFCFEFLNRFMHLGYIAYVKVDFSNLVKELTIIFTLDEVRRVVLESLIPLFFKQFSKKNVENQILKMVKKEEVNSYLAEKITELQLPCYENFDDYLEIMLQLCYLILFAGVFPQASYLCLIFNLIEYYSDGFKLTHKLYKRPIPSKSNGIGCWLWLLNILSFICVFSNTFLFAFNYYNYHFYLDQKESWAKNQKKKMDEQQQKCIWDDILLSILIIEHVMLGIILLIRYFVKSQPRWVRIFLKRQEKNKTNIFNSEKK